MKANKLIKSILVASFVITLCSGNIINANTKVTTETTKAITQTTSNKEHRGYHHRGGKVIKESIEELKKSGVLTEADVKKIDEYAKKEHEKRKAEMKQKRDEKIDAMVKENVISQDKANKLKETIDKKIEEQIKEREKEIK